MEGSCRAGQEGGWLLGKMEWVKTHNNFRTTGREERGRDGREKRWRRLSGPHGDLRD